MARPEEMLAPGNAEPAQLLSVFHRVIVALHAREGGKKRLRSANLCGAGPVGGQMMAG